MRITILSVLLIILAAALPGNSHAAGAVTDVFGFTVGGPFMLSDCASKTAQLPCADMAYMSREPNEQDFTPIRVAVSALPAYVDQSSIRMRIIDGTVTSLRYSVKDYHGAGLELYQDLAQHYGGKDVFVAEVTRQRVHVQWSLSEVLVTVEGISTSSGKNWAMVDISAQPEQIALQETESLVSVSDNQPIGGTDHE